MFVTMDSAFYSVLYRAFGVEMYLFVITMHNTALGLFPTMKMALESVHKSFSEILPIEETEHHAQLFVRGTYQTGLVSIHQVLVANESGKLV